VRRGEDPVGTRRRGARHRRRALSRLA
jgi:hypothetical protein